MLYYACTNATVVKMLIEYAYKQRLPDNSVYKLFTRVAMNNETKGLT